MEDSAFQKFLSRQKRYLHFKQYQSDQKHRDEYGEKIDQQMSEVRKFLKQYDKSDYQVDMIEK